MNDKTNKYTGLPDDLHDTYASIRVFEHPVAAVDLRGYNRNANEIDLPDGWDLIYVTSIEKLVIDGGYDNRAERIVVPVYVVGRRRDQYLDDLRTQVNTATARTMAAGADLREAFRKIDELEKALKAAKKCDPAAPERHEG